MESPHSHTPTPVFEMFRNLLLMTVGPVTLAMDDGTYKYVCRRSWSTPLFGNMTNGCSFVWPRDKRVVSGEVEVEIE